MARWTAKVEHDRARLIEHALKELTAVWEAAPQEAHDCFLAKLTNSGG